MKKLYNKIATFLCSVTTDKYIHFIVCMILVLLIALLVPILYSMLIVFIIGLSKEIYDSELQDDLFSTKDLFSDILGIIILGLILMI